MDHECPATALLTLLGITIDPGPDERTAALLTELSIARSLGGTIATHATRHADRDPALLLALAQWEAAVARITTDTDPGSGTVATPERSNTP